MAAVMSANKQLTHLLLERGALADTPNGNGNTALMQATYQGLPDIALLLLEKGANINAKNNEGWTPLMTAAMAEYTNTQSQTLSPDSNQQWIQHQQQQRILQLKIQERHNITQFLLNNGANIDARDNQGRTALMYACWHWSADGLIGYSGATHATLLMERGADVYAKDRDGRTPLLYAIQRGHQQTAHRLLEMGAYIDACDTDGKTALMIATQTGDYISVRMLLEHGANVHAISAEGSSALDYAQKGGHTLIAELLLSHKPE